MENERREYPRLPYRTTVTIEHAKRTWSGFVVDCSERGLFAISFLPAVAGDPVRMWFERPRDSMMVVVEGEVVRLGKAPYGTGEPAGFGIRFGNELSEAAIAL